MGAALLLGGSTARADDFDGKWTVNANGWTFVLKITQKGDTITGNMNGINNTEKQKIEGKIKNTAITFVSRAIASISPHKVLEVSRGPDRSSPLAAVSSRFRLRQSCRAGVTR